MYYAYIILHLFYLISQTALTGSFFVMQGPSVTCYLLRFENLVEIQFTFYWQLLSKGGNQGIILWFYYFIQNINVDGLIWFLCRINTLLIQCLNIMFMCIQQQYWGNARITAPLSKFLSLIHMNFIFKDTALLVSLYLTRKLGFSLASIQQQSW